MTKQTTMRSIPALVVALMALSAAIPTSGFTTPTPRSIAPAVRRGNLNHLSAGFFGGGGGSDEQGDARTDGGQKMISQKRRAQLGINADEEEYDLDFALEQNTDPVITKVVAGSFILVMIALLVYGVVIPSLTEYDEGICSPIQNAGRC